MPTQLEAPIPAAGRSPHPAIDGFSLTQGGPFYRLQCRMDAGREGHRCVVRRAVFAVLLTWLPLLLLTALQGLAYGHHLRIPFLLDFAANVRFLIALPLLILSEASIDRRFRMTVGHFVTSRLVKPGDMPRYEAILGKVTRLRDRALPEIVLWVLALIPSLWLQNIDVLNVSYSSWHWVRTPGGSELSYAGWWLGWISVPIYRFLLLRWVWRMYLWASFLFGVSELDLALIPTHPDKAAGLGFLSEAQLKFGIIAFAFGAVIAGQLGNAIAYHGVTVDGVKYIILAYCVCVILVLTMPLLLMTPKLVQVKRRGLLEYGALATGYTQMFDAKWVQGRPPAGEALLGSADLQSLADLGSSFGFVREMKTVPVDRQTLLGLALAAMLPMAPVVILGTPADQLVRALVKLLA